MTIVDCTLLAEVDMISAGVVGFIALIAIVLAILSAKSWHWVNVVFLILTLIASITAIVGMTMAYKHRRDGMVDFQKAQLNAEVQQAAVAKVIGGDPLSVKYGKDSLRYNNNQLALAMIARGRAWRNGVVSVADDARKFTLKNERNLQEEAPLTGAIMYAFEDNPSEDNDVVPDRYIGSVSVSAETNKDFTLQPVAIVDAERFETPGSTWTLYEKMPQDRHGIFKDAIRSRVETKEENAEVSAEDEQLKAFVESLDDESADFDIATFVEILKRDYLTAGRLGLDPDSLKYEQIIDQYAFDNQPIGKAGEYADKTPGRKNTKFDPTPEQIFIKYSFTAPSTTSVKTDGVGSLENDGMFNPAGEAVVGKLMQNPDGVSFKANDVILIDKPSSEEFARLHEGKIKEIDQIYVRELQDFPLIFKNRKIRTAKLEEEIVTSQATAEKTQVALEDARQQIDVRTDLLSKSTEDEERFTKDADSLSTANELLQQRSTGLARQIEERQDGIESLYQQTKDRSLENLRRAVSVSK